MQSARQDIMLLLAKCLALLVAWLRITADATDPSTLTAQPPAGSHVRLIGARCGAIHRLTSARSRTVHRAAVAAPTVFTVAFEPRRACAVTVPAADRPIVRGATSRRKMSSCGFGTRQRGVVRTIRTDCLAVSAVITVSTTAFLALDDARAHVVMAAVLGEA